MNGPGEKTQEAMVETIQKIIDDAKVEWEGKVYAVSPAEGVRPGEYPKVRDEAHASAIVKAIVEAEAEVDRITQTSGLRIGRAEDAVSRLRYVWEAGLRDWTKAAVDPSRSKRKSLVLDEGVVGFRTSKAKTVTESEEALLKWAEVHLVHAVEYVPKISLTAVAEWEEKNKKLAPGRVRVEAEEKFYIKAPKGSEEGD